MNQDASATGNILIVDDIPENAVVLRKILAVRGYSVQTASEGNAALKMVAADPPDLILLDIRMPGMDGFELCSRLKQNPETRHIPIVFVSALDAIGDKMEAFSVGGVDYITKPIQAEEVLARVKLHLELTRYRSHLEDLVRDRTAELESKNAELEAARQSLHNANTALLKAMKNLRTIKITDGVFWLQIPEVDLYILCGCPADAVKLMMKKGFVSITEKNGVNFETGPNAILLSEILIQNGHFSNLAEFPVLQMLYRQGMILPGHPNNTGQKPILIGSEEQIQAQMEYIHRGNYGLNTVEEIMATGVPPDAAEEMMRMKIRFAFGEIRPSQSLLDTRTVTHEPVEIRDGVYIQRKGVNRYAFRYKDQSVVIDLNLKHQERYEAPYPLEFHQIDREYFAVVHSGEGDGWDFNRPCMASILIYLGKIYLIDAGPNIMHTLRSLSIDISEIEGIFHTHAHDDHFAGLPTLMQSDHRIRYYATPLVRASVAKKLAALMSMDESQFFRYFDVVDLVPDAWNDLNGLEVKPIFSPHPVETTVMLFRTLGDDGYKTYAHWADIISLDAMEKMVSKADSPAGISSELANKVKADYLFEADIKKVDIGGGLIHGEADDFKADASGEIILAHTALPLNENQKEIGSERSFGTVDVLVSSNQDYLRKHTNDLLETYFPDVLHDKLLPLLNAPMVSFNPGSIIQKKGSMAAFIYLLLSGTVEYISAEFRVQNHLSNGCFIGDLSLLRNAPSSGTWRALSYVRALRLTPGLYSSFLSKHGLEEAMRNTVEKIDFLRKTFVFGEGISYQVQNQIAQHMDTEELVAGQQMAGREDTCLCLVNSGLLELTNGNQAVIENLRFGDFTGEERLFAKRTKPYCIRVAQPTTVYHIRDYPLLDIPVVHWKLLEIHTKRTKMLDSMSLGEC